MKPRVIATIFLSGVLAWTCGCAGVPAPDSANVETMGAVHRLDPRFDPLVPPGACIEKLASGFRWAEGPVWVPDGGYVLFSDIPNNRILKWSDADGLELYLRPAGYTGVEPRGGETGSNGLLLDPDGHLILCQHGNRQVARLKKDWSFEPLASRYDGKRLNSPNDAVYHPNGDLYFTDPPYGLAKQADDPAKELDFQGVYRLSKDGELTLLTKDLTRPNGIAFSPDASRLYVANSDPERALWMVYDVVADGGIVNGRVFFDATDKRRAGAKGLPDGMAVDAAGHLFATGPGGVLVFAPDGTHLGTIETGQATANCGFGGEDGKTLYMTAHMHFCRIELTTAGLGLGTGTE